MPGTFNLQNYDDLKFTVAKTLNRNDLTSAIPGFIVLAEAEIRRTVRRKVLRETITLTEEATQLPAACAVLRSVFPRTSEAASDLPLNIGTPEQFAYERARSGGVAGRPTRGFVTDNVLVVTPAPVDDFDVEIHYFEKLVPLSSSNASNSVLAEAPDIYYFGTLLQAAPYLKNDERVELWRTALDRAVDQLNSVRNEEEASASTEPAELPVVFG